MNLFRPIFLAALACLVGLVPRTSLAGEADPYPECTRVPSESEVSAAKGAFEAGQVSFHEADYARSILFWEDAFRRDCTAIALLLNLARAYELAEDYERGKIALAAYLARSPDDPERPAIERRMDHLAAKQEAKSAAEQQRSKAAVPPPAAGAPTEGSARSTSQPVAAKSGTSKRRLWPIVVTGVGAVATGVGLGLVISGQVAVSDYQNGLCSTPTPSGAFGCRAERVTDEDGNTRTIRTAKEVEEDAQGAVEQRTIGIVVTSVGAATAAVGAVFWILGPSRSDPAQAHWLPWLGPGVAGLSYSGAF
jgi:hypothetical protein